MSEFKTKIEYLIDKVKETKNSMTPEEYAVMSMLYRSWQRSIRDNVAIKITQEQISRSEDWMGCHSKYEDKKSNETTLRKVRQIILDLRRSHKAPILSDRNGYWIPRKQDEVVEYIKKIRQEAKSQAAS